MKIERLIKSLIDDKTRFSFVIINACVPRVESVIHETKDRLPFGIIERYGNCRVDKVKPKYDENGEYLQIEFWI